MQQEDGALVAKTANIAPVANVLHSLWDKVAVQVGDKELNQSPDCYNVRAYLMSIMNNTIEAQSEKCFAQGLMRDTCHHYDSFAPDVNTGFGKRKNLFFHTAAAVVDSGYVKRPFTFCSTLYHDLCQNDRPILWGVPIKITLNKAKRNFYMGAAEIDKARNFELVITRIELRVKIAILSEKMIQHIERSLSEKKLAMYYYRRFQVAKKPIG